ncbi:MAG: hypothetical protein H0V75_14535 [Rubrobacter sp.]|jgi:rRNA-processing protein FCF1|nr:hypothetical protein [Rubrobacter sp.]
MERYVTEMAARHRRGGVLVDTNLLLLFYVGSYERSLVERFPRTADRFVSEDFDTLNGVLGGFEKVVTTPYILTETSNLLGQLGGRAKTGCFELFARSIPELRENHISGADLARKPTFVKLGITDTSIIEVAAAPYLVLTDDFRLYNYLADRGVDVLNFNNLRSLG